ncbi:stage III sporulation protein AF [Virgibacillus sp. LDC-1]|uniref:stage III sporulation protein AF n=1 Tax=Virgibacillus sp. LDC-1 TaxID=3039856 RepID=UPI0024DE4F84|nr:stage III sporulation protein AF [Virgibacillus sp. LDC-1]
MEYIIQWVTKIVIFILLATIIDLLIPASAMKKYIKFVVGLILILIFLQPLFQLFQIDIKQAINTSLMQRNGSIENEQNIEKLIDFKKSEIQSSQNAYIEEQMAVQLMELAQPQLRTEHAVEITSMDIDFVPNSTNIPENLEKVIIYIQEANNEEGTVNVVEDVVINMDRQEDNIADEPDAEAIKKTLQEVWQIDDTVLTIEWEGE